jgi:hypothetical protein
MRRVLFLASCISMLVACSAVDGTPRWALEDAEAMGAAGGSSGALPSSVFATTPIPQSILVLDFRSGWWSGGGGGEFYGVALPALAQSPPGPTVEYHHFETAQQIRCFVEGISAPTCETTDAPLPTTPGEIVGLFGKPHWDDYTQVWILSGSDADASDVSLTGELFGAFLAETQGSCIPVLIGAGDGFITHGNAVADTLGIGRVLSTDFANPGFFTVAGLPPITVDSRMVAGINLSSHRLFDGVESLPDTLSTFGEGTHGDGIAEGSTSYQIIAHDTAGRPSIAVGSVSLPTGDRPFVIDAGFQRFYAMAPTEGSRTYLQNIVVYLAGVGCKRQHTK